MKYALIALTIPMMAFANVSVAPGGQTYTIDQWGTDYKKPSQPIRNIEMEDGTQPQLNNIYKPTCRMQY